MHLEAPCPGQNPRRKELYCSPGEGGCGKVALTGTWKISSGGCWRIPAREHPGAGSLPPRGSWGCSRASPPQWGLAKTSRLHWNNSALATPHPREGATFRAVASGTRAGGWVPEAASLPAEPRAARRSGALASPALYVHLVRLCKL